MATTSVVPAAKRALLELLAAHPNIGDCTLSYGPPTDLDRELLWFGRVQGTTSMPVLRAGRKPRDEDATLAIYLNATDPGRDPEEVEARLFELYAAIDDVCADDPTLGAVDGLHRAAVASYELFDAASDEGWIGGARITVELSARLT